MLYKDVYVVAVVEVLFAGLSYLTIFDIVLWRPSIKVTLPL